MPSYAVTGAARGIGLEFVQQLSVVPENIVFALVRNKSTANVLRNLGRTNVHIIEADITDYIALTKAAKEIGSKTEGKLDILINNAAFVDDERFGVALDEYTDKELLEKDLVKSFTINTVGIVHTLNALLPLLRAGVFKKVVTLSTGIADIDFTKNSEFSLGAAYSISKAAMNMAVVKYAVKYKKEGFTFLLISPGLVNTATKPLTPEEMMTYKRMMDDFKKVEPSLEGPISPEQSVRQMLSVVQSVTSDNTGDFISHKGNKEWL